MKFFCFFLDSTKWFLESLKSTIHGGLLGQCLFPKWHLAIQNKANEEPQIWETLGMIGYGLPLRNAFEKKKTSQFIIGTYDNQTISMLFSLSEKNKR